MKWNGFKFDLRLLCQLLQQPAKLINRLLLTVKVEVEGGSGIAQQPQSGTPKNEENSRRLQAIADFRQKPPDLLGSQFATHLRSCCNRRMKRVIACS